MTITFKRIVRNLQRNRAYAVLNLAGLSLGFAAFISAMVYVHYETSFEAFHTNGDRIYRATYRFTGGDGTQVHFARISFDYINELPNDVPAVEKLVRFQNHERKYVRVGENKFRPAHAYVADKEVFDVFDFTLKAGNPRTALAEPYSIVITEALARRYFGDADPIGKDIFVIGDFAAEETRHRVTGVMADLPSNTHLPVEMLISFRDPSERTGWAYTYLLLEEGASIAQVESEMDAFIRKHDSPEAVGRLAIIYQPLEDIHLHSHVAREIVPNGNAFYVKIAALAGVLILLVAVINFMNLNAAMALGKARELGVRKVLGASRRQVATQLLTDAISYNVAAAIAGVAMAYVAFPWLQRFVSVEFTLDARWGAAGLLGVALICGVAAGMYPVYLLTGLKPMDILRSDKAFSFTRKARVFDVKRIVVMLQFCISIMLVASAAVAYLQFRYLNERNLGIDRELTVSLPGVPDKVKAGYTAFKNYLGTRPGIAAVTACMEVPSREIRDVGPVLVEGVNQDAGEAPLMDIQVIDPDFTAVMGIALAAGRGIPENLVPDVVPAFTEAYTLPQYLKEQPRAYLINETAMRRLGWSSPEEAIGQKINWSIANLQLDYGPVVGVVRDFHQETLKNTVDPVIMVHEPVWIRTFLVKVKPGLVEEGITEIRSAWNEMFPLYPFEYYFLDELYDNLYRNDRMQLNLLYLFSGIALFIALMGLVGMIAYTLNTRVREIAIRKVLGATLADLIRMVSREYMLVLLIGGLVAIPISVYGVKQWLSGFAYHVEVSPAAYAITLSVVALLMLATIGLQTLRSSSMNPAETLRGE